MTSATEYKRAMRECRYCDLQLSEDDYAAHVRTASHNEKFLAARGISMPRGNGRDLPVEWTDRDSVASIGVKVRKATGAFSELTVAADLSGRGYTVLVPVGGLNPRYDLAFDKDGRLLRVQVKTSAKGVLKASIGWFKWKYDPVSRTKKQYVQAQYSSGDFDILAIVDRETSDVYYVPNEEIDFFKHEFYIKNERRDEFRNI